MQTDNTFFILLRAGLWQKAEEPLQLDNTPSQSGEGRGEAIYNLACEQTIPCLIADGIFHYHVDSDRWGLGNLLDQTAVIVRQNYNINQVQARVCQLLRGSNGSMQQGCGSSGSMQQSCGSNASLGSMQQSCGSNSSSSSKALDPAKPLTQASAFEPLNRPQDIDPLDLSEAFDPAKPLTQASAFELSEALDPAKPLTQASAFDPSEAFEPAKPLTQASAFEPSEALDPAKPLTQASAFDPITYVILKGQGVAQSYPKPMLRCCGDIDLFFTPQGYERAKEILVPLSTSMEDKPLSLECALVIDGVDVELHGAMTSGINEAADRHIQQMLHQVLHDGDIRTIDIHGQDVPLPSANFDAIYILTHAIRHLGSFGISLRQVIDWTMHMHSNRDIIDRNRLQSDIQSMHLQNLWNLFATFAIQYLGAPEQDFMLPNITIGTARPQTLLRLWQHIRVSGNFGHNNQYYTKRTRGRLWERYYRIHYTFLNTLKLYHYDTRFANYRLLLLIKDTFIAPFRFLSGVKTKITE